MGSRIRLAGSRLTAHTPGDNHATIVRHLESHGKWDSIIWERQNQIYRWAWNL